MGDRKLFTEQADLLLAVLNQQRHDWLNHVQVLLGHLKLGRPEAGEEYLRRVTAETHQESMIARINCPRLAVFFLTFNALHHDLRLEVEVSPDVDLSRLELDCDSFFRLVTDLVFVLQQHALPDQEEPPHLLVSMSCEDGAAVIRFDLAGCLDASAAAELDMLVGRSIEAGASVAEQIHNGNEWVLELRFPCQS